MLSQGRTMKVCILTPEFRPAWGGIGTYVANLAEGLRDKAEVHVLTATPGDDIRGNGDLDGVHFHSAFPDGGLAPGVSPLRFQLAIMRTLPRLAREYRFDILHANHAYMSDLLARLRRYSGSTVVTVHTTLETQTQGTRHAGPGVPRQALEGRISRWRFVLKALEGHYLRRTPAMIFVSKFVRESTFDRYHIAPRFSTVVPNAVDTELFLPGLPLEPGSHASLSHRPTLLFAGRLLALKGISTLLQALRRLNPEVRLLLAGPGDQGPWKSVARRLGLEEDRCRFLGSVPYAEMPRLYAGADAVVLPSFTESCPMVALEAMAAGVPLIAADAGGVSEIVGDEQTGWLFPPGDVDRLVGRIVTVLADPARASRVCSRARAWIETHASVDRMAIETYRFYERVLAGAAA